MKKVVLSCFSVLRARMIALLLLVSITGLCFAASPAVKTAGDAASAATSAHALRSMPVLFEENRGQAPADVRYFSHGAGYSVELKASESVIRLQRGERGAKAPAELRMTLTGVDKTATLTGKVGAQAHVNYLHGADAAKWITGVPTYAMVQYHGVYPGIDLNYYGKDASIEYDFVVSPGADPRKIAMQMNGAKKITPQTNGDLKVELESGAVTLQKPLAYQMTADGRHVVDSRFVISDNNHVRFEVGTFDAKYPLVIDPTISYATFIGSVSVSVASIAVDGAKNLYFVANASEGGLATTSGSTCVHAPQNPCSAAAGSATTYGDVAAGKLDVNGTLQWLTYVGGSAHDTGGSLAIDTLGTPGLVFGGETTSSDFPTTSDALIPTCGRCNGSNNLAYAGFLTKLTLDGQNLVYSTYVGGSDGNSAVGAVTSLSDGSLAATGFTTASDFPTTLDALQSVRSGSTDAFLMKFAPGTVAGKPGYVLGYSTLFGGSAKDSAAAISAVGNDLWIGGDTTSSDLATVGNTLSPVFPGGYWYTQPTIPAGGEYWNNSSTYLKNRNMTAISFDPVHGYIFASLQDGSSLAMSPDNGYTWNTSNFQGLVPGHVATSVVRNGPGQYGFPTYYVAVPTLGVFKSFDGVNWTPANGTIAAPYNVQEVSADPFSEKYLIAYGPSAGIAGVAYRGVTSVTSPTWSAMTFNGVATTDVNLTGVAWDTRQSGLVWAYVKSGSVPAGLYKSTDHGQTWGLVNNTVTGVKRLWAGVPDPATLRATVFIVDGSDKLEVGIDGQNFAVVTVGTNTAPVTAFASTNAYGGQTYFVGTKYGDVWQSSDLSTWVAASPAGSYSLQNQWVRDLAINPEPNGSATTFVMAAMSEPHMGFLLHLSPSNQVVSSQYFVGSKDTYIQSVAANTSNVAVAGLTMAADLPSGYYGNFPFLAADQWNSFVSLIGLSSNYVSWTQYLGTGFSAPAVAMDPWQNVAVTGSTLNAMNQAKFASSSSEITTSTVPDAFYARIAESGAVSYFTYLRGSGTETGNAVAVDSDDNVYVGGQTGSPDFLNTLSVTNGLSVPNYTSGNYGGFLLKIDMQGASEVSVTQQGVVTPASIVPGGTMTGSLTLRNDGPGTALNPQLAVTAPTNTVLSTFAFTGSASTQCTQQVTPTDWICTVPSIAPGATVTFPFTGTAAALGGYDYIYSTIVTRETNRNTTNSTYTAVNVSTTSFDLSVNLAPPAMTAGTATPLVFTVTNNSNAPNVYASLQVTTDPTWFVDTSVNIADPQAATHSNYCTTTAQANVRICYFYVDYGSPVTFTFSATPTSAGTYPIQFDVENLTGADPDLSNNTGTTTVTVGTGAAPVGGSRGTDFWVAFPPNGDQVSTALEVTLETSASANGTIYTLDGTVNQQFQLVGESKSFTIPTQLMQSSVGNAENKAIHITSDTPISAYVLSEANGKSDAYLAIPTTTLGTDYYTAHAGVQQNDSAVGTSQISVTATQDGTQVTIAPTATLTNSPATTVTLNQGQTYYVESASDLTNTHITATKPVAVVSGNKCATINLGSTAPTTCNFLMEEMLPTNLWGQTFATPDGMGRVRGTLLKVIGPQNTVVTAETDLANPLTIGANGFIELPLSNTPQQISTSNPAQVVLFTEGSTLQDPQGNALMMTLPAMETWQTSQDFGNPTTTNIYGTNAVLVGPAGFQYPEPPLAPISGYGYYTGFVEFGRTMLSQTYPSYTATAHTVETPAPAVSYVYLNDPKRSFATPAGFGPFAALTAPLLQITDVGGSAASTVTADTNTCLAVTAVLTGGAFAPISFTQSGALLDNGNGRAVLEQADSNGQTLTTSNTNFCLTSNQGGTTTVIASSGKSVSAPVQVNWRAVADLAVFPNFSFATSAPNTTLPFSVSFENLNNTLVQNVSITVSTNTGAALTWVPPVTFSETAVSYTCSGPGTTIVCTIPMMPGYGYDTINFQLASGVSSGTLTATITSTDPNWSDPTPGNNTGSFNYTVGATEDLYVNYVPPSGSQIIGNPYSYQIVVGNAGPANLYSIWNLTENLPAYSGTVTATAQTGTCTVTGQSLECSGTTLNAGSTETITVTITPTQSGTIYHDAHVEDYYSFAVNEADLANNNAEMKVTVGPTATSSDALLIMERAKDTISIYSKSGNLLAELPPSAPAPSQMAMSPNGRTLFVSYGSAPFISVYDVQLAKEIYRIQGVRSNAIGVTEDGKWLIVGSLDSDTVLVYDAATFKKLYEVNVNGFGGDTQAPNDLFMQGMIVSSKAIFIGSAGTGRILEIVLSSVSGTPQIYTSYTGGVLGSAFSNQFALTQDEQLLAISGQPAGYNYPNSLGSYGSVVNADQSCGVAVNRTGDLNREYMYACSGTSLRQFAFGNNIGTMVNSVTLPFTPADIVADGSTLFVIGRPTGFAAYDVNTLAPVNLATTPALDRPRAIKSVLVDRVTPGANLPVISGVTPTTVAAGQSNVITINGSNFATDAIVRVGKQDLAVTYLSATQLQVTLPSNSPIGSGFDVIVVNPTANSLQGSDSAAILASAISVTPPALYSATDHVLTSSLASAKITDYVFGRIGDRDTGVEVFDFGVSADGSLLYGPSSNAHSIAVTDFAQGTVVNSFAVSNGPGIYVGSAQTLDPTSGHRVLLTMTTTADSVTGETQDALQVIDIEPTSGNYNQVIKTIPANSHDISRLGAIAAKNDGTAAYVSVMGTDGTPRLLIFDMVNQLATSMRMANLITNPPAQELEYMYVTPDDQYLFLNEGDRTLLSIMKISGSFALAPATANRINVFGTYGGTRPKGPRVSSTTPFSTGAGSFYFDRVIVDQVNGYIYAMDHSHEPPKIAQIGWNPATASTTSSTQLALANAHGSWLGAGLALNANGSRLYAVQQTDDALSIINTGVPAGALGLVELARYSTSAFPSGVALSPATVPSVNLTTVFDQPTVTRLAGAQTTLGITLTNVGTATATNVSVSFTLPAGVQYVSSPSGCSADGNLVSCNRGTMPAGNSQSVQIVVITTVLGQQQITATAFETEADANPADNTATMFIVGAGCTAPTGYNKTWIGGDVTSPTGWDTAANWAPAGVPAASDNVYVCAGAATQPALQSNAAVNNILMETGTVSRTRPYVTRVKRSQPNSATAYSLTLGTFSLTVGGTYNGTAIGSGYVVFSGTGNTAEGYADNVVTSAPLALSNDFGVGNTMSVNGGTLTIGAHTLIVGQTLLTTSTGLIDLSAAGGVITTKDIALAGGASNISDGVINVSGNFTVNGGAFTAGGSNAVVLGGSTPQSITFTNNTTSSFANLAISNPSMIVLGSPVVVTKNTSFSGVTTQLVTSSALNTFTTNGLNVQGLYTTAPLVVNGAPAAVSANNVHFGSIVDGVNEFTINNTGGTYTFDSFVFDSLLTTGNYVSANGAIVVNMTNPTLPQTTPNTVTTGGAQVNWPNLPFPVLLTAVFNSAPVPGAAVLVTGSGFLQTTVVLWDGVSVPTTYLSTTQLQASVPANLLTSGGHAVSVHTNGGGTSGSVILQLSSGSYQISALNPQATIAGGPSFPIQVSGTGFKSGSMVLWNGSARPTTFVSSTQLTATIPASDIAKSGTAMIAVKGPTGYSNAVSFTISKVAYPPSVSGFLPTNASAGTNGGTLTVNGANFTANSVVMVNGASRSTTYVSATKLTAQLTSADVANAGTIKVEVSDTTTGRSAATDYAVADFTTAVDVQSIAVAKNSMGSTTLTITPKLGSYDAPITFACAGLPAGVACSFSPASITPGQNPTSVKVTIAYTASAAIREHAMPLFATLGFGCFGMLLIGGTKRKWMRLALLASALVLIALAQTGCGGGQGSLAQSTPPPNTGGTSSTTNYQVNITATSGTVSHNSSVTVTIAN